MEREGFSLRGATASGQPLSLWVTVQVWAQLKVKCVDKDGGEAVRVWSTGNIRGMCVNSIQEKV